MELEQSFGFFDTISGNDGEGLFYHSTFRRNWRRALSNEQVEKENWVDYSLGKKVHIYDNLKEILKIMDFHPEDRDKNREAFEKFIEGLPTIELSKQSDSFIWYNKTTTGINLRPGRFKGSNRLPDPIRLEGENTHAVVAGTTGSGKSVFLNNLILNMMLEYAPWELELYLADFKKVEMSRYMNKYTAPHVRACAATSEVDYVQSLIYFIKDRMDDRQKLFSRLGFTNIESFRDAYPNLVVPRILFLVDEFQQLFIDASPAQKAVIDDLITSITRLGRAQGVHLLFASQDMSGALNQRQLSNFNVRFALLCDANVSNDILGDSSATQLKKGQVIAKTKTTEGQLFAVPIAIDPINEENNNTEEYFFRLLKEFVEYANEMQYKYEDSQKFYDEDKQLELTDLEQLLETPVIKNIRTFSSEDMISEAKNNFMSLVLGRKVTYSNEAYDIENIFVDYSKNRCILCLSGDNSDLAYFQKLIVTNVKTMNNKKEYSIQDVNLSFTIPFFYDLNPLVSALYPEKNRLKDLDCLKKSYSEYSDEELEDLVNQYFYYRADELEEIFYEYSFRKRILEHLRNPQLKNAKEFCLLLLRENLDKNGIKDKSRQDEVLEEVCRTCLNKLKEDDSNIFSFMQQDLSYMYQMENDIREALEYYYRYKILNIRPTYKIFAPSLIFITGIENVEKLPKWFPEFISCAMDYNFLVMFFCTTGVKYDIKHASNYVFVSGNDPKMYDDYLGKRVTNMGNNLKFHCLIKNTNQKFAFKKYRCQLNEPAMKTIKFDEFLN